MSSATATQAETPPTAIDTAGATSAPGAGEPDADGRRKSALLAFLGDLGARGIEVSVTDAGGLRVKPWPQVEEADRARLRAEKSAIVELLSADVETLEPPRKKPHRVKLAAGERPERSGHRGEPRPTLGREHSRSGEFIRRQRLLALIEARDRRQPWIGDQLQAARERLGRWGQ